MKRAAASNHAQSSVGLHRAGNAHKRRRTRNAHKRAAATNGTVLPDAETDAGLASANPTQLNKWLQSVSSQIFDRDQVEEASKYIRSAGIWGIQNLRFSLREPYYGLNGNHRCGSKERTAMREAAEVLCGATYAPQINPAWSRGHHLPIENVFKDPAFEACPVAKKCLNYSWELKRENGGNPEDGLGLSELPIAYMINEIIRQALESTIPDDTGANDTRNFDYRKISSDMIIKKIIEADLVTSDKFYGAYARSLRKGPRRWRTFLMTMTTRQEAIKQIGKVLQLVANLGR